MHFLVDIAKKYTIFACKYSIFICPFWWFLLLHIRITETDQ
jgi:hypothetical protein